MELKKIVQAQISGNASEVERLTKEALSMGLQAREILISGLIAGMDVVGDKFKSNEFFLPAVLVAARAMKTGMIVHLIILACFTTQ